MMGRFRAGTSSPNLESPGGPAVSSTNLPLSETTLTLTDLDCADCAIKLETALGRLDGVSLARVNFAVGTLRLAYAPEQVSSAEIVATIRRLGHDVASSPAALAAPTRAPAAEALDAPTDSNTAGELVSRYRLTGLDCADCAATVGRNVGALVGARSAEVNFAASTLTVRHAPSLTTARIVTAIEQSGYGAYPLREIDPTGERAFWVRNRRALLTSGSGVALAIGLLAGALGASPVVTDVLYCLAMVLGGYHVARAGIYGLLSTRTPDMNILMTVAAVGAAAIGEWSEGATVVFLFALGNALEGYTMDRARGAIRALMALAPNEARVRRAEGETTVPIESVGVGEVVVVRPGEKIAVDGRVVAGASGVNQAPITGESVPVEKSIGDEVFAGSINERGYLEIEASRPAAENTISKIIQLVEEAQARRAPTQRFVDVFARYYTPVVIALAVGIATLPWLALGQPFEPWFYRALVLLVIACPCALVISTPVSIVSAIARAASLGVLVKGGAHLEAAGGLSVVAFDKTGTLTLGRPEVTDVFSLGRLPADEVLHLAAAVEGRSEHPLAAAVLRQAELGFGATKPATLSGAGRYDHTHAVDEFEAVTGLGVRALVDGVEYHVGSPRHFAQLGHDLEPVAQRLGELQSAGKTVLIVGTPSELVGVVAVADRVRPGARAAVASLRAIGIKRVVLLTGDNEPTARAIAAATGVDEFRAGLLPADKVAAVAELRQRHGQVAMVGDGVNDAPALAAATVGIAMGAAGTDVALETADIALMADDLGKVAQAIDLSRRALGTIRQNVAFALAIKAIFLVLTVFGVVTLWLAIAADMGASLVVTLNGMRLLRYRPARVVDELSGGAHAVGH